MLIARLRTALPLLADRANPMLVRRVRQELRNRGFIGAYLLMLLIAVIAAAVAALAGGDSGRGMFAAVAAAWSALVCIQAHATARSIVGDRGSSAWDLIELTGLPPLRLVAGVVQSSLVLGLLGAAGLAPFLVMSYLLRGLDLPTVVYALVALPMCGALLAGLAALVACLGSHRQARAGVGLLLSLGLLAAWGLLSTLWASSERELSRWLSALLQGNADALLALVLQLNLWAYGMLLSLVFAAALLTHRALDRSSGPRLVWWIGWANGMLWAAGLCWYEQMGSMTPADFAIGMRALSTLAVIWSLLLGLFAVSEDLDITPRQAQAVASGGRLRRAAMALLGPGASRGARSTLLMIGLSLVPGVVLADDTLALFIASQGLTVLLLGDLAARRLVPAWCHNPPGRRICTIVILMSLGLLPAIAGALFSLGNAGVGRDGIGQLLMILSPFSGPVALFGIDRMDLDNAYARTGHIIVLASGAIAAIWLGLRCVQRGGSLARVTAGSDDGEPRR